MDEKSKNEITPRKENRVLYEPPEPLFPDLIPRKRRLLPRIIAFAVFVTVAVLIWVMAVSGEHGEDMTGGDGSGEYNSGIQTEDDSRTSNESGEPERETSDTEAAASGSESDEDTENSETECNTESETQNAETSENESESENEEETKTEANGFDVREADLSQIEKGESYIINYTSKTPDIEGLIDRGFTDVVKGGNQAPEVMVIHTHTSEMYFGGDGTYLDGVVAIGDALVQRLNSLGLSSVHCTVIHDKNDRNAYLNARDTIKTMLEIYPSIKYVIDLHRLELEKEGEIIKTVSGCEDASAQIRLSVSADSGVGWQEDLALALALRGELNKKGERICMPPVLSSSIYNSDLPEYYIMADIGTSGNTVGEARAAARRFAEAFVKIVIDNWNGG